MVFNIYKPMGSPYIPYVKGVSEKFKRIGNQYNIWTMFKAKYTLSSSLMKTRLERDPQQTVQCVYNIPVNVAQAILVKQANF
jgi:hypothetical protein